MTKRAPTIPIKAIARDVGISAAIARRKLRDAGFVSLHRRWLFRPEQVDRVVEILTADMVIPPRRR